MPEQIHHDYQVSSEGAVRHWEVPYARLTDVTPTPTNPAELTSLLPGTQLTGTILTIDATNSIAVVDFTCSMVYQFWVRNVLTYAAAVEATWGAINVGDIVYYDNSATMPAGVYLSTSPLDNLTVANTRFGYVVLNQDECAADFPKGDATASTQTLAIMQLGAGG
jgi:hypothetical protein